MEFFSCCTQAEFEIAQDPKKTKWAIVFAFLGMICFCRRGSSMSAIWGVKSKKGAVHRGARARRLSHTKIPAPHIRSD